jgi:hypothetical protein
MIKLAIFKLIKQVVRALKKLTTEKSPNLFTTVFVSQATRDQGDQIGRLSLNGDYGETKTSSTR